jgi:hypothetical protein
MTIDSRFETENAADLIRVNREFDSNEIDENDGHHEKQQEQRTSIVAGISISDESDKLYTNW